MTVSRVPNVEGGIQPTIVTAKGDLITAVANANPARLGVGSDGQELRADSTAATGLSWANNFSAGKNAIINGDFRVWQRGTSFTPANGVATYVSDRTFAYFTFSTGTATVSQQTFTPGTAPVSGYEGTYFMRAVKPAPAVANYMILGQKIEDVRTFAGQTVTMSFWAKCAASTVVSSAYLRQNFGSGGSANVDTNIGTFTVTTSWQRFTFTTALASVSGKTIGTSSFLEFDPFFNLDANGYTIDTWGWQLEAGSTATAFQTATGTIQGELAACQRYYQKFGNSLANARTGFSMVATNGTQLYATRVLPVTMRTGPTSVDSSSLGLTDGSNATIAVTSGAINSADPNSPNILFSVASGLTQFRVYEVINNNNAAGFIALNAEL